MAYSDFDLRTARERLGLTFRENVDLFGAAPEVPVPISLRQFLDEWSPVALAMNTEKAKSEMIIAPILMEAVRLSDRRLHLFSGMTFDVDKDRGLNGVCDFLLTRSPERYFVSQPVIAVVEAKREDIPLGLGQCVAAMVGVRIFNERDGVSRQPVYGAVTTGNNWRFAKLEGDLVSIDEPEYYLLRLGKILGILLSMAG
jgi:hypothetical protein